MGSLLSCTISYHCSGSRKTFVAFAGRCLAFADAYLVPIRPMGSASPGSFRRCIFTRMSLEVSNMAFERVTRA